MLIDSHCHLNHEKIAKIGDIDTLIANARANDVSAMLTICCQIDREIDELRTIAATYDHLWCTVGTHPHDADDENEQKYSIQDIVNIANSDSNIIGVGECGLDYYYDNSPVDAQKECFRRHIRAARETGLPLIIHSRDADQDMMDILLEEGAGKLIDGKPLKGLFHCFSSTRALADFGIEIGFYISFSGIVTFKNAAELQDIAKAMPAERILVETDAPYLAPEPHRGRTNEPALVKHTAEFVANLRGISYEELATLTTNNFYTLFDHAKR